MRAGLIKLTMDDYDECLSLMNNVFSESRTSPMDLARELPKVFASQENFTASHWGIYEDGRLIAAAGFYPYDLVIFGHEFHCATIGNIVTHPSCREKGHMHTLMAAATQMLIDEKIALSRLSGARVRYNHFNYEKSGSIYNFTLTARNAKDNKDNLFNGEYYFIPMNSADESLKRRAFELYSTQPCRVIRHNINVFCRVLESHYMTPYIILDKNGDFCGYLTAAEDNVQIGELFMSNPAMRPGALGAWIGNRSVSGVRIGLFPWDIEGIRVFSSVCEHFSIDNPCMFRIMDWSGLADALIKTKNSCCALPRGEAVIEINGYGKIILQVDNEAQCVKAPSAAVPDMELNLLDAARFLFGPHEPCMVAAIPADKQTTLGSWLPLPLTWFYMDNV